MDLEETCEHVQSGNMLIRERIPQQEAQPKTPDNKECYNNSLTL